MLFSIFKNDLEKEVNKEVKKAVDDTELRRILKSKADCEDLQKELMALSEQAIKWKMKFNIDKCT